MSLRIKTRNVPEATLLKQLQDYGINTELVTFLLAIKLSPLMTCGGGVSPCPVRPRGGVELLSPGWGCGSWDTGCNVQSVRVRPAVQSTIPAKE
jgi:hypothetical protein